MVEAFPPPRTHRVRAAAVLLFVISALAVVPGQASAEIVSYTDASGVIHLSTRPKGSRHAHPSGKAQRSGPSAVVPTGARSGDRADRYAEWIRQAAALYQIPESLIRAVIQCESDYDPRAVSPVGAQGLMQLMPETALRMQVRDPSILERISTGARATCGCWPTPSTAT